MDVDAVEANRWSADYNFSEICPRTKNDLRVPKETWQSVPKHCSCGTNCTCCTLLRDRLTAEFCSFPEKAEQGS